MKNEMKLVRTAKVETDLEENDLFVVDDPVDNVGFVVKVHMNEGDWEAGDILERIIEKGIVVAKYASCFKLEQSDELWKELERKYKDAK